MRAGTLALSACLVVLVLFSLSRMEGQENPLLRGTQMDVDLYGNIYLVDSEQDMLRLFSPAGKLVREVGGAGWQSEQFDRPAAVWARNGIDVFVADYGNHRIQRFDRGLNFISSLYTRDNDVPDERFGYPTDVVLSRLGDLYVCDGENARIVKVNNQNQVVESFGGFGAGKGRMEKPTRIEAGPNDHFYVLDGSRVVVFDSFGNFVHELAPGLLNDPSCLHADDDGVAVIDSVALYCFDGSERPRGIFPVASLLGHSGGYVRAMAFFKEKLYLLTEAGLAIIPDPRAAVR